MNDDERASRERATVVRSAIDEGIAELDAGLGAEMTVDEVMAEARREASLDG